MSSEAHWTDPQVAGAVAEHRVTALQADLTRPDPWLEEWLIAHGGVGLPFVVVLNAAGEVVKRLPGLFTTASLMQAINDSTQGKDS